MAEAAEAADAGPSADKPTTSRPKSSKVWEHFVKKHEGNGVTNVICNICNYKFAWHGSTSMMNEHLKRKHVTALQVDTPG